MPIYEIRDAGYCFRLGTNLFEDGVYKAWLLNPPLIQRVVMR